MACHVCDTPEHATLVARVAVASYYAGHDGAYFRIRFEGNGKDVAYWDEDAVSGVVMIGEDDQDLEWIDPPWPAWALRVDELESELPARASAAATA